MKMFGFIGKHRRNTQIREDRALWEEAVSEALAGMDATDYEKKAAKILYMGIFDEVIAEEKNEKDRGSDSE